MKNLIIIVLIAAVAAILFVQFRPQLIQQENRLQQAIDTRLSDALDGLQAQENAGEGEASAAPAYMNVRNFIVLNQVQQLAGVQDTHFSELLTSDTDALARALHHGKASLSQHLSEALQQEQGMDIMDMLLLLCLTETPFDTQELAQLLGRNEKGRLLGFDASNEVMDLGIKAFNLFASTEEAIPCEKGVCYLTASNMPKVQSLLQPAITTIEQHIAPMLQAVQSIDTEALASTLTQLEEALIELESHAAPLVDALENTVQEWEYGKQ